MVERSGPVHRERRSRRRFIEKDPRAPDNPGAARLRESGVHVWALVVPVKGYQGDIRRVAEEYDLTVREVKAAMGYYNRHQRAVDAEIASITQS